MIRPPRAAIWAFALWLLCLLATAAALQSLSQQQLQNREAAFAQTSAETITQIADRMRLYQYGLRALRGVATELGPEHFSRESILRYTATRDAEKEFPGTLGFGLIRRVPVAHEAAFLKQARAEGRPEFAIRQLSAHENERFVIQYIEPESNNKQAIGLDIASESNRRNAALDSLRYSDAVLTHPITLVQATGKAKRGFLLLLPVYLSGGDSHPDRAWAFSYTALVIDDVLAKANMKTDLFHLTISNLHNGQKEPFYSSITGQPDRVDNSLPKQTETLEIYGRTWTMDLQATPAFTATLNETSLMNVGISLAAGSTLLALLAFFVLQNRGNRLQRILDRAAEAKILEQRVEERTQELQAALHELTELSYASAHSLRTPLRSIDGYAALLLKQPLLAQEADGIQFLARIRSSAQRMGQIIDEINELNRIFRIEIKPQWVNLSEIAETVKAELHAQTPERKVKWSISPDLHAFADPYLMNLVLRHLLSNALKYTSKTNQAEITFFKRSLHPTNGGSTFCVKDDGIGFDAKFAKKLFLPFQKLHTDLGLQGSGIGLALVLRSINKHGGQIEATSEEGQGACFCFTLPDPNTNPDLAATSATQLFAPPEK